MAMGKPRFATADDIGKRILVGMTHVDRTDSHELAKSQQLGTIFAVAVDAIHVRWESGDETTLPLKVVDAKPGTYRLRSSGKFVVDPDLLSAWTVAWTPKTAGDKNSAAESKGEHE
jgi:hypothetical protein